MSATMSPRVTVIIPTYNWSTVLPYSIGSVLDQTFSDFELLVIGDGCTDDSVDVVNGIGDPRVRWISIPRSGHQSVPNNEGLRQARGECIAYLGHDDLWLPHHLACAVEAIGRGADLTHSIVLGIGAEGSFLPPYTDLGPPSAVVHRRAVTDAVGGWRDFRELSIAPEFDLWQRVAAAGHRVQFVPRLTGVKFAAAVRRNVYRERPSHEQASWLARIRAEPDLEVVELAKIAVAFNQQFIPNVFRRIWRLMSTPSLWGTLFRRSSGARIRARQRFKGVDRTQ